MDILPVRGGVVLLISMIILAACEYAGEPAAENHPVAVPVQLGRVIQDDGILQFNPKNLHKGDKLSITMPLPHPKELAIKAPDGRWFYLQVEDEVSGELLMPSGQFSTLKKLDLDTRTLEARYWDDGKARRGKVFNQSGDYLIYMADNLETEPQNTLSFASIIHYSDSETTN